MSEPTNIAKLFDSRITRFEIPSYQRSYSWEKEQIYQFIEDLKNAGQRYYLGHFIFEIKEENILYIIDGQQRLTTLVIFFSVLKQELGSRKEKGEKIDIDLDDISDTYLRDLRKRTQKFKTVKDDNNFFAEEIIDGNKDSSQEADTFSKLRIREAKNIFQNELSLTDTDTLTKWFRLIENATVTQYIVEDKTQATQVFAFQNDRGKKLSNLEIIKAFFMLQLLLSDTPEQKVREDIEYIEDEISKVYRQIARIRVDEDEVLNYYWRAESGKGFYSEEVIKGIKERMNLLNTDKSTWIKQFIAGLSQAFQTVEKIEKSDFSYTKDLHYLNNMALSYPFLIKAYKFRLSREEIERLIKLLENITFRYLLRGGRAEIESRLNPYLIEDKWIKNIDEAIQDIIANLKTNNWWSYWSDSEMEQYLRGYFYRNRVDNYLLWKYELYLCDENHPKPHKISFNELIKNESMEHIAPQTPTNGDPIANGYGIYVDSVNPQEGIVSGNWLNCVGNLLLDSQSHNSFMGNKAFRDKLASYGKNNLLNQQKEIPEFVSDPNNPVWNKTAIEKRRSAIINAAKEIWNLDRI